MDKPVQDCLVQRYIKNIDKTADKIMFYTKISSVYKYKNDEWVEMGIEGTCIIYTKTYLDLKVICVLNRKRKDDFFLCIGDNVKIKREGNILILVNRKLENIYGVWFCDPQVIEEVLQLFQNK